MKTGVMGGEPHRAQSPPARISVWTSPSHPSFTPCRLSSGRRPWQTGVGIIPQEDGGLLTVLADTESGGVDGDTQRSGVPHWVFKVSGSPSLW